jgi:hypothetical protein
LFDTCRLVRQVKQFSSENARARGSLSLPDPCRLAWQVKQFSRYGGEEA